MYGKSPKIIVMFRTNLLCPMYMTIFWYITIQVGMGLDFVLKDFISFDIGTDVAFEKGTIRMRHCEAVKKKHLPLS